MNAVLTWKSCVVVMWSVKPMMDDGWVWFFFSWACINSCPWPKLSWLVLVKYTHQSTVNSYLFLKYRSVGYFCPTFSKLPLPHWVMVAESHDKISCHWFEQIFFHFILSSELNKPVFFFWCQSGTEPVLESGMVSHQPCCFRLLLLFSSACEIMPVFVSYMITFFVRYQSKWTRNPTSSLRKK